MAIRAGALDRKLILERRLEATDSAGQVVISWQAVAVVAAQQEPLGGREGFGQQQFVATGDVRWRIRWRGDVHPLHRVRCEGRAYDVVTVLEEGRREALLIVGRARTEGAAS